MTDHRVAVVEVHDEELSVPPHRVDRPAAQHGHELGVRLPSYGAVAGDAYVFDAATAQRGLEVAANGLYFR
jgi:hypothetical protein